MARLIAGIHTLLMAFAAALLLPGLAVAKEPQPPGVGGGGSLPLADLLQMVKPYPNLVLQVRLELVRASLARDKVVCTGRRFANTWPALGGARIAPYECPIGKRTLVVTAAQTFYDKNGHRLRVSDPELPRKAAKVKESGITWRWK